MYFPTNPWLLSGLEHLHHLTVDPVSPLRLAPWALCHAIETAQRRLVSLVVAGTAQRMGQKKHNSRWMGWYIYIIYPENFFKTCHIGIPRGTRPIRDGPWISQKGASTAKVDMLNW